MEDWLPIVACACRCERRRSDFAGGGGGSGRSLDDLDDRGNEDSSFAGVGGAGVGAAAVEPLLASSLSDGGFELLDMERDTIFVGLSIEFLRGSSYDPGSSTATCQHAIV